MNKLKVPTVKFHMNMTKVTILALLLQPLDFLFCFLVHSVLNLRSDIHRDIFKTI